MLLLAPDSIAPKWEGTARRCHGLGPVARRPQRWAGAAFRGQSRHVVPRRVLRTSQHFVTQATLEACPRAELFVLLIPRNQEFC
jgi:hypothetical protein